ncbi:nicotinate-nucleotide--dimethylbenzimidazole phosphoribosyltransferase [Thiohalomonas denitrificans]|uniref:Nicotinate-nucleotide--dimethylbenzimidazole phosphoribosyltransferase n=1 Tax=Thiohalomonas denitrificans TaxID=415747 RepID=A0A1G5PMH8_9GAMM|nr:nicotinate-nucleotide--dimethylbenzimidazole phosphoribosyltransferase [Thiohalomonas denitrificans]SCZ50754.1 nicotinate-nucleotide-dimethylbenzimidazole phosphoribosyltransferase [Thiohalomonas denitrificans]
MHPEWLDVPCAPLDETAEGAARKRQSQLTKPPGSLGQLESIAIELARLQGSPRPGAEKVHIAVFAGDHGVAAEGISLFPQSVTAAMVRNFAAGGTAISVLARELKASLEIINLGTVDDPGSAPGVLDLQLAAGTANFTEEPAMTREQLFRAMNAGRHSAERAHLEKTQLFIGGEMGIGNTTSAAAIAAALLGRSAADLVGPGTGLDPKGVSHKAEVIERAFRLHAPHLKDPLEVLRRLGGFEIAGLAGAFIACAQTGLPVVVDGFIATAAAVTAEQLRPGTVDWLLFSHASAEPGHAAICEALGATPLLDLGMRLGEGSGAAAAVPLIRLACALHNEMATFEEAGLQ